MPSADAVASSEPSGLATSVTGRSSNLTILTGRLNSRVSNGPWLGKADALRAHEVLFLNRDLVKLGDDWDEVAISDRTERMLENILDLWPVPEGHQSDITLVVDRPQRHVDLSDLISAGVLEEGMTLYARPAKHDGATATLLPDGSIDLGGTRYTSPSGAAKAVAKRRANGWAFWGVGSEAKTSLRKLWREYVEQRNIEADDTDVGGEDEDDEG